MKSLRWLPPFVMLFAMTAAPVAVASSSKSLTVINNTTYTMTELYASSTYHSSSWDSTTNLLTGQSIAPGQSATVAIADGTSYCHYDFMGVLYGAAQRAYQYEINTCDGGSNWSVSTH